MRLRNLSLLTTSCFIFFSCAPIGLYNWGSYEEDLLDAYTKPETKPDLVKNLEKLILKQENSGYTVAPGLYAELGTLYLENHHNDLAIYYYEKEYQTWPESQPLMQRLISNLEAAQ